MAKTERNASVTLSAGVSTQLCEEQTTQTRTAIVVTNCEAAGGDTAYISIGEEAKANTGIPLQAGQTMVFSRDSGYTPSQKRINAFSSGAIVIAVYEECD